MTVVPSDIARAMSVICDGCGDMTQIPDATNERSGMAADWAGRGRRSPRTPIAANDAAPTRCRRRAVPGESDGGLVRENR
jgi:hypothetical protein